jgi:uncharacterized protein YjbI with pentapeptide repeats
MIKVFITREELESKCACDDGLKLFYAWFGNKVELALDSMTCVMIATSKAKEFYSWAVDRGIAHALNLRGANLEGADLRGANLRGAKLYGANLEGALHSEFTQWPAGFDKKRLV